MKKLLVLFLITIITLSCFMACAKNNTSNSLNENDSSTSKTDMDSSEDTDNYSKEQSTQNESITIDNEESDISADNNANNDNATGQNMTSGPVTFEVPRSNETFYFDSLSELYEFISDENTASNQIHEGEMSLGSVFINTLTSFENETNKLIVPTSADKESSLIVERVTLFSKELYNLPWIWYHCKIDGQELTVSTSYVSVLNNTSVNSANTYASVLKLISPNAPSTHNYTEYPSYSRIYEKEITLAGKIKTTALISELKDNRKQYVEIYLNGVLISLSGKPSLFTDEFFASFSLTEYQP